MHCSASDVAMPWHRNITKRAPQWNCTGTEMALKCHENSMGMALLYQEDAMRWGTDDMDVAVQ